MRRFAASLVKWVARLLLLAVPFVIVSALLWPRGIQVLNPAVCPEGLHLDNRATGPSSGAGSVELTCRGGGVVDNVTLRLAIVVLVLAVLSGAAYYLSSRLAHPRARRPPVQVRQ